MPEYRYQAIGMNADGNPRWPSLLLCLKCGAYVGDRDVHNSVHGWKEQPMGHISETECDDNDCLLHETYRRAVRKEQP